MNKADVVEKIVNRTGTTKKDAMKTINAFIKTVEEALVEGEKVQLMGFGTFETRKRKGRQGKSPRNPQQVIEIKPSTVPVFKAGKPLKDAVNN